MEVKSGSGGVKELNERGEGLAVIASLGVLDKDRDFTERGAFGKQWAPFLPAHDWSASPLGKAKIYEDGNQVFADFKLNLKNSLARDWYESLRFDLDNGPAKMEFSYGYSVLDSGFGEFQGQRVRFLKKVKVHEISPVILGAGIGTRLVRMKHPVRRAEMDPRIERAYAQHLAKWHYRRMESRIKLLTIPR